MDRWRGVTFAASVGLLLGTGPAFSEYSRCTEALWVGDRLPILRHFDDLHEQRETHPGWLCVDFEADRVVLDTYCGVFYSHHGGGSYSCTLGVPCQFGTTFTQMTDEISGERRKICVYMARSESHWMIGRFVVSTYRP